MPDLVENPNIKSEIYPTKGSNDNRDFKVVNLTNGLRCILVSDKSATKSAAFVAVKAGSYQDPDDRAGVAHFLEHMLFLGTEKYPGANDYFDFIRQSGGLYNGVTSSEITYYYFTVLPKFLVKGLDMLSQFFKAPKFDANYVARELNSVEAEFTLNLNNDLHRNFRISNVTCNQKHPFKNFVVGNAATLKNDDNSSIRDEIIKFYDRYYTAPNMSLVLVGPQSIAELQQLAIENFIDIKNTPVVKQEITELAYTRQELGKMIRIKPISAVSDLVLSFPLLIDENYIDRPFSFVKKMLEQESEGSLAYMLKQKNYINSLSTWPYRRSKKQKILKIFLSLTDAGYENYAEITKLVFAYVNYLKSILDTPVIHNFYQQLKLASIRNFNQPSIVSAHKLGKKFVDISKLEEPDEDLLVADYFQEKSQLNKPAVTKILNAINHDNLRVCLIDKRVATDKVEPIYDISYACDDINPELLDDWKSVQHTGKFNFAVNLAPAPENFTYKEVSHVEIPQNITKEPRFEVWYKADDKFKEPKVISKLIFNYPFKSESATSRSLLFLLEYHLDDCLDRHYNTLELVGAKAYSSTTDWGVTLNITSYADKADQLLKFILNEILTNKITPDKFAKFKECLKKKYLTIDKRPLGRRANRSLFSLIDGAIHPSSNLLDALDNIDFATYSEFVNNFFNQVDTKALFSGNITREDADSLGQVLPEIMPAKTTFEPVVINSSHKIVPPNEPYQYILQQAAKNDLKDSGNDVCLLYYQSGNNIKDVVLNRLLNTVIASDYRASLRTEQQLAYSLYTYPISFYDLSGIVFLLQSNKITAKEIKIKIEEFLQGFEAKLEKIDSKEFNEYKNSIKSYYLEKNANFSKDANFYWKKIINGTYSFDRSKLLIDILDEITPLDLLNHFKSLLNSEYGRLVVANTEVCPKQDMPTITDVDAFKSQPPSITKAVVAYPQPNTKEPILFSALEAKKSEHESCASQLKVLL